jgi:hypothetical protein
MVSLGVVQLLKWVFSNLQGLPESTCFYNVSFIQNNTNLFTLFPTLFQQISLRKVVSYHSLELTLLTLTGQTILQTTLSAGETSKTISVAHLPAGVYLCRWQEVGGGASEVLKVAVFR